MLLAVYNASLPNVSQSKTSFNCRHMITINQIYLDSFIYS